MSVAKASKRLSALEAIVADESMKRSKDDFLERFMICECVYKNLLKSYNANQGARVADRDLRLYYTEIRKVLDYYNVKLEDDALKAIFFSTGQYRKRGTMSAKKLRDSIAHSMNEHSIKEVEKRFEELMGLMDAFLSAFRNAE